MKTQALLLADDPVYGRWLSECLGGDVTILPADASDPAGFVDEVSATPGVGLAFIQFDETHAQARAALVEQLHEIYPQLPVIAVGESEQSDAVLTAMRSGVRDYFVLNRDDDNLSRLVERVLRRSSSAPGSKAADAPAGGKLISVLSSPNTPGTAFLAVHMAEALRQSGARNRVLLLDLTLPGGAALVFLDTEQSYSALDALRDVYRCDQTLVDTAFSRYRDGFFLLTFPETHVSPPVVDIPELQQLLRSFIGLFDYVVVSADAGLSVAGLSAIVSQSDQALLLTDQSVLKSRQNKHLLHALRQADTPLDNLGLVIDAYQPKLGLEAERMASLLDLELTGTLAGKTQLRIEAMNAGELMFEHAPRDPYCREVRQLLERFAGPAEAPAREGSLIGRLFGN